MIWIITDTHWNHDNIIKYENRPEDFKEQSIANWKVMVGENDTIVHLGDVIFKRQYELCEILAGLPGIKILTVGNHDKRTGTNSWFLRMGFNYVCKSHSFGNVIFSHKPLDLADYPGIEYNIHGHFHTNSHDPSQYPYYDDVRHICVSLERTEYKPVRLDELIGS